MTTPLCWQKASNI